MTDPVNTPAEPPAEPPVDTTNSLLGTPPAETNPTDSPVDVTQSSGAPESADGYEVNIDGFDFNEFKGIEENKAFLDEAHKAGLSNEQLGFVLGKYNEIIPQLMEANAHLDNESCIQTMTEAWGNDTQVNFGFAKAAADNAIANGILTAEEVNSPEFGNNPLVLKMAAYFGQQLGEDTPPKNTHQSGATDVQSLMSSEAYLNESHPDHKRVFAQVQNFYQKQYK